MLYWTYRNLFEDEVTPMAQTKTPKLDAGDHFPAITIALLDGSRLALPSDLNTDFTVFLGYRGKW